MNRLPRSETLLVLACAAGAAMLAASQFTTMFELTPQGGEAQLAIEAADQHGYATLVLAVFALAMLVVGIAGKSESTAQIAGFAVAACGAVALLIFLAVDLPDANSVGTLDDARESFIDAQAEPKAGFWFELIGSLVLAVCGGALATLGPEGMTIGTRGGSRAESESEDGQPEPAADPSPAPTPAPQAQSPAESPAPSSEREGAAKRGLSLPSVPRPKLPIPGRRKRIGRRNERPKPEEPREDQVDEGFNWPSRSGE